jgi:RNA polymerase sigma-70 factor (ECF subfamily)
MAADSTTWLIQQIRAGNPDAWEQLIDAYEGRLAAFVRARLSDPHAVEDVVQETLLGFLRSLPHYDDTRNLESYLFTIAAHKIRDHLRRNGRHPLALLADREGSSAACSTTATTEPEGDARGASSLFASAERMKNEEDRLAEALKLLLDEWREAGDFRRIKCIELLLVCGWGNRDVATKLGLTEQQVANYKFQVVERLARRTRPPEEGSGS